MTEVATGCSPEPGETEVNKDIQGPISPDDAKTSAMEETVCLGIKEKWRNLKQWKAKGTIASGPLRDSGLRRKCSRYLSKQWVST